MNTTTCAGVWTDGRTDELDWIGLDIISYQPSVRMKKQLEDNEGGRGTTLFPSILPFRHGGGRGTAHPPLVPMDPLRFGTKLTHYDCNPDMMSYM